VQTAAPFMLCFECHKNRPDYFSRSGKRTSGGTWLDYQSGLKFQLPEKRWKKPINSHIDLWGIMTQLCKENGFELWKTYEKLFSDVGNFNSAALCRLRQNGIFNFSQAYEAIDIAGNSDDLDLAKRIIDDFLILAPDNLEVLARRGLLYRAQGELDLAIQDFSTIIQMSPDSPFAYSERLEARIQMNKKDYAAILSDLQVLDNLGKLTVQMRLVRAMILMRPLVLWGQTQDMDQVAMEIDQVIAEDPDLIIAYKFRGFLSLLTEDNEEDAYWDLIEAEEELGDSLLDLRVLL
jgi:tetratricopeptide (TPR) repeat protein